MHRDRIREAEIAEEELPQRWGEMACVADPDALDDDERELLANAAVVLDADMSQLRFHLGDEEIFDSPPLMEGDEDEEDDDDDDHLPDTVRDLQKITLPLSEQDLLDLERADGEGMSQPQQDEPTRPEHSEPHLPPSPPSHP